MGMALASPTGVSERTIVLGEGSELRRQREEYNRLARSAKGRRERLETRVGLAKKMKLILADAQWSKKRAAATAALADAKREFAEASKPFARLKTAEAALFNAQVRPDQVEGELRAALIPLEKEAARAEDFVWSDVVGELQIALDHAMNSRGPQAASVQKTLKNAIRTADEMPTRFIGSFAKWESLLVQLRRLAQSRGTEMAGSEQWASEIIFEPVELDGAGR